MVLAYQALIKMGYKPEVIAPSYMFGHGQPEGTSRDAIVQLKVSEAGISVGFDVFSGSNVLHRFQNDRIIKGCHRQFEDTYRRLAAHYSAEQLAELHQHLTTLYTHTNENIPVPEEPLTFGQMLKLTLVPKPPMLTTPILLWGLILVWLLSGLLLGVGLVDPTAEDLIDAGGLLRTMVITDGEYWRLITSMFQHAGIMHLLFNSYALLMLGLVLEPAIGSARLFTIFFFSGLMGAATSLAWHSNIVSVGASGAIFGLFGFALVVVLNKRSRAAVPTADINGLVQSIALSLVYGMVGKNIDNAAHLGGLLGGLILGGAFILPFYITSLKKLALPVGSIVIAALTLAFVFNTTDHQMHLQELMANHDKNEAKAVNHMKDYDQLPLEKRGKSIEQALSLYKQNAQNTLKALNAAKELDAEARVINILTLLNKHATLRAEMLEAVQKDPMLVQEETHDLIDKKAKEDEQVEKELIEITGAE